MEDITGVYSFHEGNNRIILYLDKTKITLPVQANMKGINKISTYSQKVSLRILVMSLEQVYDLLCNLHYTQVLLYADSTAVFAINSHSLKFASRDCISRNFRISK